MLHFGWVILLIVIALLAGAVGGFFGFNPLFVALLKGMGIVQAQLPTPLAWTVLVCLALIILSYVVSILISWRIRKISAYSLISE